MADSMTQFDRAGHIWEGPITDIRHTGLNSWRAMWTNENHRLEITLYPDKQEIDIWEMQPEQHWVGPYEKDGDTYSIKGGPQGNADRNFTAIVTLAK